MTIDKKLQVILNRVFPKESGIKLEAKIEYTRDGYQTYTVTILKNNKYLDKFNLPVHAVNKLVELDDENK